MSLKLVERPGIEFAELELADADDNEIAHLASQNLPITLPWGRKPIPLGICYQSQLQSSTDQEPWLEQTPFILSDVLMMPKILHRQRGTDASYRSVSTSRECETGDHLTLGFGVGVGLPFLASVSVKGTYDKEVLENRDSNKTSIRSRIITASVELEHAPRLTTEAILTIKYGGGYEAFCEKFGDYYVAGYRIGGETGLMISSSNFRSKKVEKFDVKVTLEVLFFEASKTWSKDFFDFSQGKSLKLIGYDTVDKANWKSSTVGDGTITVKEHAKVIVEKSHCVLDRVDEAINRLGLCDGMDLTGQQCDDLANAGLVLELILLPMSSLRDVARWRNENNII